MRISILASTFMLLVSILSCFVSAESVADDSKKTQYLFSLSGKSGTYKGDTLTLKDVPFVVYFSERPVRKTGHISLEEFVRIWNMGADDFNDDPPNAELSIYELKADKHAVLILSRPMLKEDIISFEVRVLSEEVPESFGHSILYIDNFRTVGGRMF